MTDEGLRQYLNDLAGMRYFVFSRERGDGTRQNPNGTIHIHGYIAFRYGKRFNTMRKLLSKDTIGVNAHIEPRRTSRLACINYVKKIGFYSNKAHTRIGKIYEYGDPPILTFHRQPAPLYPTQRNYLSA